VEGQIVSPPRFEDVKMLSKFLEARHNLLARCLAAQEVMRVAVDELEAVHGIVA